MKLFALIHDPAGDRVSVYEGMDQATITSLVPHPVEFVDKNAYDGFVLSHQPVPLTLADILTAQRTSAINQLVSDVSPQSKFVRAVLLTVLDEVNTIRALLPGPPAPRTAVQLRNAVQAKINAGTAD